MRLKKDFFDKPTIKLAQDLLGTLLVHKSQDGLTIGRIVETEAYLFRNDPSCHAARGKTKRNEVMFKAAGHAYVYFIYGVHYCFNIVSGKEGEGEAVLIRALEPVKGIDLMQKRRNTAELKKLCSGPGKLVQAMGIDQSLNGSSMLKGNFYLTQDKKIQKISIVKCTRIGIKEGGELLLRFYIKNSEFVSKY